MLPTVLRLLLTLMLITGSRGYIRAAIRIPGRFVTGRVASNGLYRRQAMGNYLFSLSHPYISYFGLHRLFSAPTILPPPSDISTKDSAAVPSTEPKVTKPAKDWNLIGLKEEIDRVHKRTFKKVEKANERLRKAREGTLTSESQDSGALMTVEEIERDLSELSQKLQQLIALEEDIKSIKSTLNERFSAIVDRAIALDISDSPPPREDIRREKKHKLVLAPRRPYFTYESADGILLKVGRTASDNDEVSLNKSLRDDSNWWMHVSGTAGSHVVICSSDDAILIKYPQTILDAALLASVNSKSSHAGRVQVHCTRCRNISKPAGAKPGLVYLSGGELHTIKIDINAENARLERLMLTKDKDVEKPIK